MSDDTDAPAPPEAPPAGPLLRPGETCWRVEQADRFGFIVDGADYFVALRAAMLEARRSILLIGWDFDSRIRFGNPASRDRGRGAPVAADGGPERLGDFLLWLAERTPGLEIRLLRWDVGALKALIQPATLVTILRWKWHPRITLKLDGAHPRISSHHQKIVSIDDRLAFCGGIDITLGRWDRRDHRDEEPGRAGPDGRPSQPWHDATSVFDGPAARAIGDLARARWRAATGRALPPVELPAPAPAADDGWPAAVAPTFRDLRLGIARTQPEMPGVTPVHEIEAMYLDLIARARHTIYAESQYFASRRIARAIAERLVEPDGPEIVIINPVSADGWLEPLAMDSARARLVQALRRLDTRGRLRIFHPVTATGTPIYVHAKVMVVDDLYLRVGSSNFNNRSLRLDTECDVIAMAENAAARATVTAVRDDLIAEHLDLPPEEVTAQIAACGSLIAAVEALCRPDPRQGGGEGRTLVPYVLPELGALEEWLADNEILDPDGPEMMFESLSKRGLFRNWPRHILHRLRHRRPG